MNPSNMSPDDPKLTAYALGELDGDESALVAKAIRHDPAAQAAVREIQALAGRLESALADEPIDRVSDAAEVPYAEPAKIIRFPYYAVSGLAAACFALLLILRPSPMKDKPAELPSAETVAVSATPAVAPAVATAPAVVAAPVEEEIVAIDVAKARRLPVDAAPDINPSPALEGGLKLGRTVAAADAEPLQSTETSLVDEYSKELLAFQVEAKLPATEVGSKIEIPAADLSGGATRPAQEFKLAAGTFVQPKKSTPVNSVASYDKLLNWAQTKDAKEDTKSAVASKVDENDETAKKAKAAVE